MGSLLHDPVADARNIQGPHPSRSLGNVHPTRWPRMVRPLLQFPLEVDEEDRDTPLLDGLDRLAIDSGGPTVGSNRLPRALHDGQIGYIVVERVASSRRVCLGGPITRPP